ncbi:MAG: hypothetical protein IMY85_05130 [Chloroflexi bacterium]|nr:hypothetical protein [Chloroflexota bacterium]
MKHGLLLLAFLLILVACSPPLDSQSLSQFQTDGNSTELNNEQKESLDTLTQSSLGDQFQSLFIDLNQVKIVDSSQVEWSDTCLGVEQPGVDCLPQSTQGYRVVLETNGLQFEVHADHVGGQVKPATLGLRWTRECGEDGLCDHLLIYLPDSAHACWFQSGEMNTASVNLQEILSPEEYEQLIDALRNFSENTVNLPSSDATEPVMVTLTFYGQGNTFPSSDDQQSLLALAENIFARITP